MAEAPKTLRDEFAMAAMQAVVSCLMEDDLFLLSSNVAGRAYEIADAMMAARALGQGGEEK